MCRIWEQMSGVSVSHCCSTKWSTDCKCCQARALPLPGTRHTRCRARAAGHTRCRARDTRHDVVQPHDEGALQLVVGRGA